MNPQAFRQLLVKYRKGQCTEQEKALVDAWYANLDGETQQELDAQEKDFLEARIWAGIRQEIAGQDEAPRRFLWPSAPRLGYAAASVVALLGMAWYALTLFPGKPATGTSQAVRPAPRPSAAATLHRNDGTTARQIVLPDGSRVSLQPASQLSLSPSFNQRLREVTLVGEAFFDVKKDARRPFVVHTRDITTRVLGTSFNVRAYPMQKNSLVFVKTGRVSVSHNRPASQKKTVVLTPNQQLLFVASAGTFRKEIVAQPTPSAEYKMEFEEKPVGEVLHELEETFGVPIQYDREALKNCNVTVVFHREDLPARLDVLCKLLGATYEERQAGIVFRAKGCVTPN